MDCRVGKRVTLERMRRSGATALCEPLQAKRSLLCELAKRFVCKRLAAADGETKRPGENCHSEVHQRISSVAQSTGDPSEYLKMTKWTGEARKKQRSTSQPSPPQRALASAFSPDAPPT